MNCFGILTILRRPRSAAFLAVVTLVVSAGVFSGCGDPTKPTAERVAFEPQQDAVNINTANRSELEMLPGIGPGTAEKILLYRQRHGRFRRAEHLMLVRGIGEKRFRRIRHLVRVR